VFVPAKNVVTFKPGKEMEELVRKMNPEQLPLLEEESEADTEGNGPAKPAGKAQKAAKASRAPSAD
jgi:hypothetical protein